MKGSVYREALITTLKQFTLEDKKYHRRLIELTNDLFFKVFNYAKIQKKYEDECDQKLVEILALFRKADYDLFLETHDREPTRHELTSFRKEFEFFKDWRRLFLEGGFG